MMSMRSQIRSIVMSTIIVKNIDMVDDWRMREVLILRYVYDLRWDEVVRLMGYDVRWVYRLHHMALKRIGVRG